MQKDVSEITTVVGSMSMLDEAKRATEMLGQEMNSVLYIYDADFRNLKEVDKAAVGESSWLVAFLLFGAVYNLRC